MKAGYQGMAGRNKETQGQLPFNGLMFPGLFGPEQKGLVQQSLPLKVGSTELVDSYCLPALLHRG